jgi:DNA-binding MarR family transcriptional regulator
MSRRDVHRNRGADPFAPNVSRTNGRAPVARFLDAIDRAGLSPMDMLLLLHVADAEATARDLAEQLDRRPADIRRATGRLVARGLLRRRADRTVPLGLLLTATASGLDLVRSMQSSFPGTSGGEAHRPPRRDPQPRRLTSPTPPRESVDCGRPR